MSAFLGPVHYWLFKKVIVIESRAFAIASSLETEKGEAIREILAEYGESLENKDLAELVGQNPIHQFLMGLIAKTQVLEASIVKCAGDDLEIVLKTAEEHGLNTAKKALADKNLAKVELEEMAQFIGDYQLEGMPCDPGAEFNEVNGSLMYGHRHCNHIANWEYTGVDIGKMCDVTNTWLKGFVKGLNVKAQIERKKAIAKGDPSCESAIKSGTLSYESA